MNIIEAVKSGKRFGRRYQSDIIWFHVDKNDKIIREDLNIPTTLEVYELLADDWVVEEEKIEITRNQFFKASEVAAQRTTHELVSKEQFTFALAEALGFKE